MGRSDQPEVSETIQQDGWIWRGRRFGLKKYEGGPNPSLSWDFEFVDFTEGVAVAFINKDPRFGYEVYLTLPNSDPYQMESIRQICTEVPQIIRAIFRSKS